MQPQFSRMKYTLYFLLAFCFLSLSSSDAWGQKTAKLAYKAAETLRKQNKCQQAILKYDEAIKEDSDNYTYHFQKGRCQYSLGRYDDAIAAFNETLKHKENFANAFAWLARSYKNKNDLKSAATYFKLAARHETRSNIQLQYYLLLVNILLDQNELVDTRKYLEAAKEIAPSNPNVMFYEAELAAKEKRWTAAEQAYEKALASDNMQSVSDSRKAKYYYGLGLAKSQLGDKKGAQEAWEKAKFGPYTRLVAQQQRQNGPSQTYKTALSYYFTESYEESEYYADQLISMSPDFAGAYVLKGKIAEKRNQQDRALYQYQKALELEKEPAKKAQTAVAMANIYLDKKQATKATQVLNQTAQSEARVQQNSKLLAAKARAEMEARYYDKAVLTLEMLLTTNMDPKNKAKYSFMLGKAALKTGDKDKAKKAFEQAAYGAYKPAAEIELDKLE